MVVAHSYVPQWPEEVELTHGNIVQVLSKQDESRWSGQLQNVQQGYFLASCVIKLSHNTAHVCEGNLGPNIQTLCEALKALCKFSYYWIKKKCFNNSLKQQ